MNKRNNLVKKTSYGILQLNFFSDRLQKGFKNDVRLEKIEKKG